VITHHLHIPNGLDTLCSKQLSAGALDNGRGESNKPGRQQQARTSANGENKHEQQELSRASNSEQTNGNSDNKRKWQ